jgi:hypothetical protein
MGKAHFKALKDCNTWKDKDIPSGIVLCVFTQVSQTFKRTPYILLLC